MKRSGSIDNSNGNNGSPPSQRSTRQAETTPPTPTTEAQPPPTTAEQEIKTNQKTKAKEKQNVLRLARGNTAEELEESTKQNKTVQECEEGVRLVEPIAAPQVLRQRQQRDPRPLLPRDSVSVAPAINEGEKSRPGVEHVPGFPAPTSRGMRSDGEENQEETIDLDTLAGNTLVHQAELVAEDAGDYEQLQKQVDELNRQLQNRQTVSSERGNSQPVLATVVVLTTAEENIGAEDNTAGTKGRIITAIEDDSKDISSQGPSSRPMKLLISVIVVIVTAVIAFVLTFLGPWNKDGSPIGTQTPSELPSPSPTIARTASPTSGPTGTPSELAPPSPTKAPTMTPTLRPTGTPTKAPTTTPTSGPTASPAPSIRPTQSPTTTLQNIASIVGVENLDLLSTTSPEYQALEWMTFEDPLRDALLASVTTSEGPNRIISERYAIVVLYYATNGVSWANQYTFLSGTSVCDWNDGPSNEGVYCNGQGTVARIRFFQNGLSGNIPSQIGELLSLQSLDLFGNESRGTIPDVLGSLAELTFLSIWENRFIGTIPEALSGLTKLTFLSLGENELTGTIPPSMGELTELIILSFTANVLRGTVPSSFQSLTALRELYLDDNRLTGNLDPIFCPRPASLRIFRADCSFLDIICNCCTGCRG